MTFKRLVWVQEAIMLPPLRAKYGDHNVHAKVRMNDVISEVDRRLTKDERQYLFLAHFDFLITDTDFHPQVAFEVDGAQHFFDK